MPKDPAFLFYSNDWLQGTAKLMPEEKGVYIDLLAHHHQDGDLPNDTKRLARMTGLSEQEFIPIWSTIRSKFVTTTENRLVNRKLTEVTTKRSTKSRTNKINGIFASLVRLSKEPESIVEILKKSFDATEFDHVDDQSINHSIHVWWANRLKSIVNVNGTIEDSNRGVGEEEGGWNKNPGLDAIDLELPELKSGIVIELFAISKGETINQDQVLQLWGIFKKQHFNGIKFYDSANDTFSHFINWSKKQTVNGTHKQTSTGNSKSAGASALLADLKTDIANTTGRKKAN